MSDLLTVLGTLEPVISVLLVVGVALAVVDHVVAWIRDLTRDATKEG